MQHRPIGTALITLMLWLALPWAARAQGVDLNNKAFVQAGVTVMLFDRLNQKCKQGASLPAAEAAKVQAWQDTNGVDKIRTRLRELSAEQREQIERAAVDITAKTESAGVTPCDAMLSVVGLPESQFAAKQPQLLAQLGGSDKSKADKPREGTAPTPNATSSASANNPAEIIKLIEGFGFDTRTKVGFGGFVGIDTYPVVLFRNGDALRRVEGLAHSGGLEAHKRAKPDDWTQWRRSGGELQLQKKDGWKAMAYKTLYTKLPSDFKLDGLFSSISGGGNLAAGGTQSVIAWKDYRFSADGTVVRGGGASSSGREDKASVNTQSIAASRRGRYRIEQGLVLSINYDDGSSEQRIIITDDAKSPKNAIWLDGVAYLRPDTKN